MFQCFGRLGKFSEVQAGEIATGLGKRGQGSCGCCKSTPLIKEGSDEPCGFNVDSVLPEGFRERTRGRGLVVQSWVLQLEILKKESVGGFVPHSGWNFVLEAVVAGVPMMAWPLYAEQHLNSERIC